jgi:hypothetical protein
MDINWLLKMPQMEKTAKQGATDIALTLRAGDLLTASVIDVLNGNDALISFGQFKAYARLPLPVITGQEIQIKVEEAESGLRMTMLPRTGGTLVSPEKNEALPVRLFEPVSDHPFLSAYSRSLAAGESMEGRITGFEKDGMMLVDFGKFKAFSKIDIPVREGQTLPLRVVESDLGLTLSIAPKASGIVSARGLPSLAANGTSTEAAAAPSGQIPTTSIADAPGAKTTAGTAHSTPPTAREMAQLREQIRQLLDPGSLPDRMTPATSLPSPIKAALVNLQQLLHPASPTASKADLMEVIRSFVDHSGIFFEKHLEAAIRNLNARPDTVTQEELARHPSIRELIVKDLKPNLMILNAYLEEQTPERQGPERSLLEMMRSIARRSLTHIEQQQVLATEKPVDPELLMTFSHLMLLTETRHDARLKVYYAKKGRDGEGKKPRVALLLEMDRMGSVRTDLWMVGRDLNITFFVEDEQKKAIIDGAKHRVGKALASSFNTIALNVVVNVKKIAQFDEEEHTIAPRRQVDLSV